MNQTAEQLVPGVSEADDRMVFRVQSRSRPHTFHMVDMEARHGLGDCSCKDCKCNKNIDCYHIQKVRKYVTVKLVLVIKESHHRKAA